MKIGNTCKIKLVDTYFIALAALLIVALNCRGFRLMLPEKLHYIHMNIAKVFSVVAVVFFACRVRWMEHRNMFLSLYLIGLVLGFFIPQLIYTMLWYGQSFSDYYDMADQFMMFFWTVPLFYMFVVDGNVKSFLTKVVNIIVVGYFLLAVNVFLKNTFDFSFFQLSGESWQWRDGIIRVVDCSSFVPLVVAFIAGDIIEKRRFNHRHIIAVAMLGIVFLYVERTRMSILATLFMIYVMMLFNRKKHYIKKLLIVATAVGFAGIFAFGYMDRILDMFSVANNGNSTLFRLNELDFYMGKFLDNIVMGIGMLTKDNIIAEFNIQYWSNHNYEDIGIFGILGVLGLSGFIILFVIPMVRMIYIAVKLAGDRDSLGDGEYIMLVGLIAYMLVTSFTLVVLNYPRIPLLPFVMAVFEYYYYKHKELLKKENICC